jgi:hypothetical protein
VSQTITFSQASYVIETDASKPTNALAVTDTVYKSAAGKSAGYLLQNYGNTTIQNLTLQGENAVSSGLNVSIQGVNDATTPSILNSNLNFGTTNDFLVIGSSSGNTVNLGSGNDRLSVNYASSGDTFNAGLGSDSVVFGGNINNTTVNLGSDGVSDVVRLAQGRSITGLVITGADNSDVLFIGTTQYNYSTTDSSWTNTTDNTDKKYYNSAT